MWEESCFKCMFLGNHALCNLADNKYHLVSYYSYKHNYQRVLAFWNPFGEPTPRKAIK